MPAEITTSPIATGSLVDWLALAVCRSVRLKLTLDITTTYEQSPTGCFTPHYAVASHSNTRWDRTVGLGQRL